MESNSSRIRINQFFSSKKRKQPISPGLKAGKIEKDANTTLATSPSAKGTLNNFLVASQDCISAVKPSYTAPISVGPRDPVIRNLALEIKTYSDDESEQKVTTEGNQKGASKRTSDVGDVAAINPEECASVSVHGTKNSELKQFANDFLSLYCCELRSNVSFEWKPKVNDQKRHGSTSLLDFEDKTSNKRHCAINQPELEGETTSCMLNNPSNIESGFGLNRGEYLFNSSRELSVSNPTEFQAKLRKCNRTPSSTREMAKCQTPGSLKVKASVGETPRSTRGSSIFSPGEDFWNEAIQIADGFCPTDKFSVQAAEVINTAENDSHTMSSYIEKEGNTDVKSKEMPNDGESRVLKVGASSLGNDTKDLKIVASPLPVKHFDFSREDSNVDDSVPHHFVAANLKKDTDIGSDASKSGFVNKNKSHHIGVITPCSNLRSSVELQWRQVVRHDNGSITSTSPANEISSRIGNRENGEASTPSSFVPLKNQLDLISWLPPKICSIYRKKGISRLYPWQVDCLQVDGVLQRKNLVYCASTSAGKSFVAEILMLRRVISTGKVALLVLPYVSICAEKAEHLEVVLEPLGKQVRSFYGNQGGGTLPKDTSVAVCTIEKANSLINRLLEEGRLSEIGIIVIDELHMVGDQNRGYLLELMLTKLRYAAGEGNSELSSGESSGSSSGKADPAQGLQIVGMSATMPNVAAVADWLQAALYETEFRPVPLEEYIKVGNTIYDKKMDVVRTISKTADLYGKDPDHIVELCNEVVQDGNSVLIFCSSRKGCESTARHVSKFLKKFSLDLNNDNEFVNIASAIDTLRRCPAGLDPVLEETLPSGVAYHHAGLTVEEREIVETCYRRGLIRVLTATSTLAAGVNLPARRVIFRQPRIGCEFIDGTRYKQMSGRAGRTGIDTKGESVLICKPEEIKRIMGLLNESGPALHSCLSEDKNGMTHAILEAVAGGIVQTANDIHRFVKCTLLNSTKPFQDVVKSAQESLRWLCHRKFLEWNEQTKLYSTTPLGRAAFGSSLCPEESLIVLDDLSRAREGFVLASDLHLVYLVTPINIEVQPDWELYYERFLELSTLDQSVGNRVGVAEPFLMRMAHGAPIRSSYRSKDNTKRLNEKYEMLPDEQTHRVCKRFYVALILSRLVQEAPVAEVCKAFKVARGMVQALQENAGRFASMLSVFCERLGWHDIEGLVVKFQNRVSFGVRADIAELTTIPYVKGSRARALYNAGLRTPLAIAEASVSEILKALFESSSWAAEVGSGQRRVQLGVSKKIKNGARKIVLDKAEEARVAAFLAFKSLGISVPEFSGTLLSTAVNNLTQKLPPATSSGDDSSYNFVGTKPKIHVSPKSSVDGAESSEKNVFEIKADKLKETSAIGLEASRENVAMERTLGTTANSSAPVKYSSLRHGELSNNHTNAQMLPKPISETKTGAVLDQEVHREENLCLVSKENACDEGPIHATSIHGGIDSFLDLWDSVQECYFDIHYGKQLAVNSISLFEIHGIAICWESSAVFYVSLPKDLMPSDKNNALSPEHCLETIKCRWKKIGEIMHKKDLRKFTWKLKIQIQVLKRAAISVHRFDRLNFEGKTVEFELIDRKYFMLPPIHVKDGIDMCIVSWILWPDEERSSDPNLEKEVKKRLSCEAAAAANRRGRWKNQMRRAAHSGCCRRVAQTRALCSVLWKLLISEGLIEPLLNIEIPLVNVLADMERWGIGVDMEACLQARNVLGKKLRCLEKEAYKLAGMTFSMYSAADIANVLYGHLKLAVPEGHNKGKQHPSTDKHCLDLLRHEHPIVPIIKEHRTLAKLLNCTLGSICSMARLSSSSEKYTIHGHWLQTSTATGRLSIEEPNLQCVQHTVVFKVNEDKDKDDVDVVDYKLNARDFFLSTQDNWLLLTADYSQIELRLMAHFSKDSSLIELLREPHGDVFAMIAAKWTGKPEDSIVSHERDQTKRLVYGILYGMGASSLAEQLDCSSDEAAEKIKSFKSYFPGVASWLNETVTSCRQKGYVETLMGRKRFLSKIKFGNNKERSKAQRQAVNSICQGTAADIIKIAMLNIYSVIVEGFDRQDCRFLSTRKFEKLKGRCQISLQVHDELVLEVDPSVIKEAALLLQTSMERAALLLVPLRVKLKVGRTWGSLEPFQTEQDKDEASLPMS